MRPERRRPLGQPRGGVALEDLRSSLLCSLTSISLNTDAAPRRRAREETGPEAVTREIRWVVAHFLDV